jgi:hypothetical protein
VRAWRRRSTRTKVSELTSVNAMSPGIAPSPPGHVAPAPSAPQNMPNEVSITPTVILDAGGDVTAIRGAPLADGDESRILEAWNAARDDEYREFAGECAKFVEEVDHEFEIEKFTLAELEEEEAELEKLQRWHQRIRVRDVREAAGADTAQRALQHATAALERYSAAVFERTQP